MNTPTDPNNKGPVLLTGQSLQPGWYLQSPLGFYTLVMQASTGNLVLTPASVVQNPKVWTSGTGGNAGAYCLFTSTGDLQIWKPPALGLPSQPLKHSGTTGGYGVVLCDSGDIMMYDSFGAQIWDNLPFSKLTLPAALPLPQAYPGLPAYQPVPDMGFAAAFQSLRTAFSLFAREITRLDAMWAGGLATQLGDSRSTLAENGKTGRA